jgi:hypothetical protein
LRWAAARESLPDASGEAVLDRLASWQRSDGSLPTRIGESASEYRETHYLFDHIMLWDGLTHWARQRGSKRAGAMARHVLAFSEKFHERGRLNAVFGAPAPRWSGRGGPFLLKVCARLRHADGALAACCAKNWPALARQAREAAHGESHPQLYAIEGLIELDQIDAANDLLDRMLEDVGGAHLMTEVANSALRRSDVLAQLLRAACLLGRTRKADPAWSAVAMELASAVDSNGRVPFASGNSLAPTWSALFAEQALSLWQDPCQALPPLV